MEKIGIITFHNSYNCGSMLESYAMQEITKKNTNNDVEIINFSNEGQKTLYSVWFKNNSIKNIIKNLIILPAHKRIQRNNEKYEEFKNKYFNLSKEEYTDNNQLSDKQYSVVIAGSDQIWNITIQDNDDAYFLNWVKNAKKVAYAPSFGAMRIEENTKDIEKYKKLINDFESLSIRENNGQRWIKELTGKDVPVLLDPTLLLDRYNYDRLIPEDISINEKFIFFYSPSYNKDICKFVKRISRKYNLPVYVWSTKSYCTKFVKKYKFKLPKYENPEMYLYLIKNAELILTTSYHGTIFSTIYRKKFITIKNGGMYGNDDRVITLLNQLNMMDRLIPYEFDENFDYLQEVDYTEYEELIEKQKNKSIKYLKESLGKNDEKGK